MSSNAKGDAGMEVLIPVVNKLQDIVFSSSSCGSLDLPQVVVVGAQSSGKSSVIELLVRRDFLPRGTGIVTRRPLAISLINDDSEYCEFLHLKGRRITDYEEVRAEIEKETLRVAGSNKGISPNPISLKVHSPHVLDLTIVDLPGVTKVPIGDQPADIEKQTKELVMHYISNKNSIILAVTPANQDLVNSESLKMARSVDPDGRRTLGVLTKLDLMDKGTNALDILNGVTYPLHLGFIGIVNRSQQDIEDKKTLEASLEAEREFFRTHPAYRSIAHKCGTSYLSRALNQILMVHIRERLPDIKARLNTLIGQTEQEIAAFGQDTIPNDGAQQGAMILTMMMEYSKAFVSSIDGNASSADVNSIKELGGGARIYQVFSEVFDKSLRHIDVMDHISYSDVRVAIRNSSGPRSSLFMPELAFDTLVKPLIKQLEQPSLQCVQLVYEELMSICHKCGGVEFDRFPRLRAELVSTLSRLLNERLGPTSSYISSLIEIQRAYIKTDHEKFISPKQAMDAVYEAQHQRDYEHMKAAAERNGEGGSSDGSGSGDSDGDGNTEKAEGSASSPATTPVPDTDASPAQKDLFMKYFLGKSQRSANGALPPSLSHLVSNKAAGLTTTPGTAVAVQQPSIDDAELTAEERSLRELRQQRLAAEAEALTPEERLQCDLMFKLIQSYFAITRETVSDQVPKAIMHFLVNHTKVTAQQRLVSELYKEDKYASLLFEDESLVQERTKLQETLNTYRKAATVITEVI